MSSQQHKMHFKIFKITFDEPFTVPIHGVVPWSVWNISWGPPQDQSVALTVPGKAPRDPAEQSHPQKGKEKDRHPLLHPRTGGGRRGGEDVAELGEVVEMPEEVGSQASNLQKERKTC